ETKIIPGHGPLADKAALEKATAMIRDVRARILPFVERGASEAETVAAAPLADLAEEFGQGFVNEERMTRTAYRSLKATLAN
ncbi:MAG: MBL fold metallo-hydrolase, partial [Pseudomonadota bacterium]